ncbi:MAG TPA: DUF692 domain-containing protein [Chromatiales bacterium]|nr:DUF692 domain-containing protein [Chromatiales bacterium]
MTDQDTAGFGLWLTNDSIQEVAHRRPAVDWFEIISENFLPDGSGDVDALLAVRRHYPIAMHGVSLSIGCPHPLDQEYLQALKQLAEQIDPLRISDHLCSTADEDTPLYPLPRDEEMLRHVTNRIGEVQALLGRQMLFELTPATEAEPPKRGRIPEWQFAIEIAERSDSLILLDLNNLHSSCVLQDSDPFGVLEEMPIARVSEIHIAFTPPSEEYCLAEESPHPHGQDPILALYEAALRRFGPVATLVERADAITTLEEGVIDANQIRSFTRTVLQR